MATDPKLARGISLAVEVPPFSRGVSIQSNSINQEKRTVEVVWTTGARVMRGLFEPFWEELSLDPKNVRMDRLNNGAPFLNSHDGQDASKVVGVVENARIENGRGVAMIRFAKAADDPVAESIWRKIQDGILQNISVGYRTYRSEKVGEAVDGTPVYRAIDWEPFELSVVPMGADDGAGFRSAERLNQCVFVTRQENTQMANDKDAAPVKDTNTTSAEPQTSAAITATREAIAARTEDAKERAEGERRAAAKAVAEERERQIEIRKIGEASKLGGGWANKLIEGNVSIEEARKVAFEHMARVTDATAPICGLPNSERYIIEGGDDETDKFVRGATAWLIESAGLRMMMTRAAKEHPDRFGGPLELNPGEFRGLKLYELARRSLERRGVHTRGMSQMTMVGTAFTYRAPYQTTGDFPVLLENVMNKVLLGAYALMADTWSRFCRVETLSDFRASNRYRTGSLTALDVVNEHGEFTNKSVPDGSKIAISLQTYGNIVALTRQTIINDDLGALSDMAVKLGRAAKLTVENAVYALLALNSGLGPTQTDSQPFFHSNRANVNSTGSALTAAGLDADRVVMGAQKDINGVDYLDLRPSILLVPASLAATARVLNGAPYDPISNMFEAPNTARALFTDIIDTPRLTGTRRYLLADPSIAPIIVVAFLEGQGQAPTVDAENGWRIDGVEWKVRLDAKAQMFDPKGGVTNAGT